MCVSYCVRQGRLYWNHFDCEVSLCRYAGAVHQSCPGCRWRQPDGHCGLTRAPLPADEEGCCHYNVSPPTPEATLEIRRELLTMLAVNPGESVEAVLRREDISYRADEASRLWVSLDELALPLTYGRGTEHLPDEAIDWSGWFAQWPGEPDGEI